ncbi:MoaD/ThiS family protein [Cellulomonas fimi]|uniref:MoaD/ThiS family protein n=1 Tax=Cellulomonas fimi TaxID=1708 RepID=UPI002359349C|nr:MoaD/ThiS family protein [Cellulomonas fimi]
MTATIVLPAVLAARAGGARTLHATGGTLREVLADAAQAQPAVVDVIQGHGELSRFVNVYVDAVDVRVTGGLDTPVTDGAEITVIPAVAGG